MRKYFIPLITMLSFTTLAQEQLTTDIQRYSYAMGIQFGAQIGQSFITQTTDIDRNALLMGISDVISGQGLKLTTEEMQAAVDSVKADQEKIQQAKGIRNKLEGDNFLKNNKNKEGIIELSSGLQYKVIIDGTGDQPATNDLVVVHYRGSLVDGTVFDSSYERGKPQPLSVNSVIPGWQEILPLMKVGSKWQIFIPSDLAYGEDAPPIIGPNATLIFDIELLGINN